MAKKFEKKTRQKLKAPKQIALPTIDSHSDEIDSNVESEFNQACKIPSSAASYNSNTFNTNFNKTDKKFLLRKSNDSNTNSRPKNSPDYIEDIGIEGIDRSQWGRSSRAYYQDGSDLANVDNEDEENFENMVSEAKHVDLKEQFESVKQNDFSFMLIKTLGKDSSSILEFNTNEKDKTSKQLFNKDFQTIIKTLETNFINSDSRSFDSTSFPKDNSLTELKKAINSLFPELIPLLTNLQQNLIQISEDIHNSLLSTQASSIPNKNGFSLLKSRNKIVLGYCIYLCYYIYLKSNGQSIQGHPIIKRLLEFQILFKKLKPIEQKIRSQIEREIREANQNQTTSRAKPNLLMNPTEDINDSLNNDTTIYIPPKLLPTESYPSEENATSKQDKLKQKFNKRFTRAESVQAIRRELNQEPEEIDTSNERIYFKPSNSQNHSENLSNSNDLDQTSILNDPFNDPRWNDEKFSHKRKRDGTVLNELVGFADSILTPSEQFSWLNSNKIGTEDTIRSTDKGIPLKTYFYTAQQAAIDHSRTLPDDDRIVQNRKPSNQPKKYKIDKSSSIETMGTNSEIPNNSDYLLLQEERKKTKFDLKTKLIERSSAHIPTLPKKVETKDRRATTRLIDENKGIMKKRKAIDGNARVKYKLKHQNKMKKFRSTHSTMRSEDPNYQGEHSGIKSKIAKSTKLS